LWTKRSRTGSSDRVRARGGERKDFRLRVVSRRSRHSREREGRQGGRYANEEGGGLGRRWGGSKGGGKGSLTSARRCRDGIAWLADFLGEGLDFPLEKKEKVGGAKGG